MSVDAVQARFILRPEPADAVRLVGAVGAVVSAAVTVKFTPLVATPLTVTTTTPVVAPAGTGATMPPPLQLVGVAAVRLNVTVPCVVPKFVP